MHCDRKVDPRLIFVVNSEISNFVLHCRFYMQSYRLSILLVGEALFYAFTRTSDCVRFVSNLVQDIREDGLIEPRYLA